MSALKRSPETGRVERPVRVAIRNGEIVRVKRCSACGLDKLVSEEQSVSEFPRNGKKHGRICWKPQCKKCFAAQRMEKYYSDLEAEQERKRAWYHRWVSDAENAATLRDYQRTYRRERRKDPAFRSVDNARGNRWKEAKLLEDPTYFTAQRRAERMARHAVAVIPPTEGTRPRMPLKPFRDWLLAYKEATGLGEGELAEELLMGERRLYGYLNDPNQKRVAVDVVDKALGAARWGVHVWGKMILRFDDLYPEEEILG